MMRSSFRGHHIRAADVAKIAEVAKIVRRPKPATSGLKSDIA
jgi:hypothetical protein